MTASEMNLSYRRAAIQGASPIGLVIALYDTLAGDLRRGSAAIRRGDIQQRCTELNHAMTVLGQLEDWVDRNNGGELARSLTAFYNLMRAKMLEASAKRNAATLDEAIGLLLHVRTAWQQRDSGGALQEPTAQRLSSFAA